MKRLIPACPFLWATAPVLFLFAYNIGEVQAVDLFLPMLVVVGVTLACLLLARRLVKNHNKAILIVSFAMFWVFAYGYLADFWQNLGGAIFEWRPTLVTLLLWGAILALVVVGVLRMRRSFNTFTKYLSVVGIVFVAISLANMGVFAARAATADFALVDGDEGHGSTATPGQTDLPDIYYIILDSYTRADKLYEVYGFDNSEFINYLGETGFYVASKSRYNYSTTPSSLASSLNMEYLNYLSEVFGESSQDVSVLWGMQADSKLAQFLESRGYSVASIAASTHPSLRGTYNEIIENQSRFRLSYFASSLLQGTPLRALIGHLAALDYRSVILSAFDAVANASSHHDGPLFVFAHIVAPHGPYMFDRNGNIPEGKGTYVEQVMFVNMKVEALVDEILLESRVPPIIVLQGDTGLGGDNQLYIFNAYLFPDRNYDLLYESITPVNSFRVILNQHLGADYELLEDKSYITSYKRPFQFSVVEADD